MLTIYHIEGRRSQAVVWLCEELGLPYELVFTRGDVAGSVETIRKVNPLMPVAPSVRYDGLLLVETAAILQLLLARHGEGRLEPAPTSADYAYHLMWLHFAEGSVMPRISGDLTRMRTNGETEISANLFPGTSHRLVGTREVLAYIENYLADHPYFGGAAFSAADIMMHFSAGRIPTLPGIQPHEHPRLSEWKARVEGRPAFARMMAAALPDGVSPDQAMIAALMQGSLKLV